MNQRELDVKKKLESEGYRVLRNGAPDFLALRVVDGKITEIKGVEVKSRNCNKLTYEQGVYREVFREAGLPFEVVIAD